MQDRVMQLKGLGSLGLESEDPKQLLKLMELFSRDLDGYGGYDKGNLEDMYRAGSPEPYDDQGNVPWRPRRPQ
jgi:hypothetical protein